MYSKSHTKKITKMLLLLHFSTDLIWFALCGRAKFGTLYSTQNCESLPPLINYGNLCKKKKKKKKKLLLLPHFFTDFHSVCFI